MAHPLDTDPYLSRVPTYGEGYKELDPCLVYLRLGEGGMGAVYRAYHLNLEFDVAVKCLNAKTSQAVKRFQREAQFAAKINHQNLIRVHDIRERHGVHYLIMELVHGENLRARSQRKGPLPLQEALSIVKGAAAGLEAAHRRGVIHRDIKPENIMISAEGEVKLTDLGLAKDLQSDIQLSASQNIIGTPQYMPPEQWKGAHHVSAATDVWALGATLYYLLAGKEAVPAAGIYEVMSFIASEPFPDIRAVRPDVPAEVSEFIARCTRKDPKERFSDATDLLHHLEPLVVGRTLFMDVLLPDGEKDSGVVLVSPPPVQTITKVKIALDKERPFDAPAAEKTSRARPAPGEKEAATDTKPEAGKDREKLPWIALGAAVVIVLALLGALWKFWPEKERPTPPPTPPDNPSGGEVDPIPKPRWLSLQEEAKQLLAAGRTDEAYDKFKAAYDAARSDRSTAKDGDVDGIAGQLALAAESRAAVKGLEESITILRQTLVDLSAAGVLAPQGKPVRDALEGKFLERSRSLRDQKQIDKAITSLEDALGAKELKEGERLAPELRRLDPELGQLYLDRARARRQANDLSGALDDARKAEGKGHADAGALIAEVNGLMATDAGAKAKTAFTSARVIWSGGRVRPAKAADLPAIIDELPATATLELGEAPLKAAGFLARLEAPGGKRGDRAITFDASSTPEGRFTLKAVLINERGTEESSAVFDVLVDLRDPELAIELPKPDSWLNRGQVEIRGTVRDANPPEKVLLEVAGAPYELPSKEGRWEKLGLTLPDGGHLAKVSAFDAAGKTATSSVSFNVDTRKPELSTEPLAEKYLAGGDIVVRGKVDEDVELSVNGQPVPLQPGRGFEVKLRAVEGLAKIFLSATDRARNTAEREIPVMVEIPPPPPVAGDKNALRQQWLREHFKTLGETLTPDGWPLTAVHHSGIEMLFVPAGSFRRPTSTGPATIAISRPFYIGKFEVPQAVWEAAGMTNRSETKGAAYPVQSATVREIDEFVRKLRLDLPTEWEWEWAAAGTDETAADGRRFPWGDEVPDPQKPPLANLGGLGRGLQPVDEFPADVSFRGVRQMAGNVAELCKDNYVEGDRPPAGADPQKPDLRPTSSRVCRGGAFKTSSVGDFQNTARRPFLEGTTGYGFRVLLQTPKEPNQ
jgi:serine/threonine protein kinase/formylglycine-generating enzyme required for sulfatase activity